MGSFNPFKAAKKVVKGVTKVVKGVAKAVKKVAKGVMKVMSKMPGMKLLNKLGPLGTIAMNFMLPGIGSAFGSMWSSAAGALTANTIGGTLGSIVSAVGQGMTWIGNAAGTAKSFLGDAFGSITDKITGVFKQVGGSVSEGFSNLWNSAKDFVGMGDKTLDAGKFVAEGATKTYSQAVVNANPEFLKMAGGNINGAVDIARQQSSFLGEVGVYEEAAKAGIDKNIIEMAKATNTNPFGQQARMLAEQNFGDPTGTNQIFTANNTLKQGATIDPDMSFGSEGVKMTSQAAAEANPRIRDNSSNLMDSILKSAAGGLNAFAQQSPFVPFSAPGVDPLMGSNRFGVGGEGAAGGAFLTPAQLQQQQLLMQQLKQQG